MAFILTSYLKTHIKDDEGNRHAVALEDENYILTNIKKYVKKLNRIVYVANFPESYEETESRMQSVFDSFDKTGMPFKEKILLDARNKQNAKEIVLNADLIILSGGKCIYQNAFLKEIGLKEILKKYNGLVIGISAGTMNLCQTVANFPEELADLTQPRWLTGLGFCNKIIIPHFDGENIKYQIECEEVDIINDSILPISKQTELIGLPNGSYILIDENGAESYFGDVYKIHNEKVMKIN